jgi:hypothetical protein
MSHAEAADFSHKLHLKLIPKCTDCHTSVASSTKVEDNLLPTQAACTRCHADGVSIREPDATVLARFSHQQHLQLGNVSKMIASAIDRKTYLSAPGEIRRHLDTQNPCGACHRGLEESDAVTHSNLPQMADCLVCHSKIDPPDSCATCHLKTMALKPASHDEGLFSNHSSGKLNLDKTTCAVCHGRRFTCLGCH